MELVFPMKTILKPEKRKRSPVPIGPMTATGAQELKEVDLMLVSDKGMEAMLCCR
ncbi:hypothetical protein [Segetibacter aerophilus]|uniref:hypothetical protein n=1 Tax=Segetibacter aerophilus TaxID=670293 RepID=UPI00147839C1|nr:hypothetical protein [Segetibacter aerophilus]